MEKIDKNWLRIQHSPNRAHGNEYYISNKRNNRLDTRPKWGPHNRMLCVFCNCLNPFFTQFPKVEPHFRFWCVFFSFFNGFPNHSTPMTTCGYQIQSYNYYHYHRIAWMWSTSIITIFGLWNDHLILINNVY